MLSPPVEGCRELPVLGWLHGGGPRVPTHRVGGGTQAAPAAVVLGPRAHGHALDVRPVAARQRPSQPALAGCRGGGLPREPVRLDGWHQRRAAQRPAGGALGPGRAAVQRSASPGGRRAGGHRRRDRRRPPGGCGRPSRPCATRCNHWCRPADWWWTSTGWLASTRGRGDRRTRRRRARRRCARRGRPGRCAAGSGQRRPRAPRPAAPRSWRCSVEQGRRRPVRR